MFEGPTILHLGEWEGLLHRTKYLFHFYLHENSVFSYNFPKMSCKLQGRIIYYLHLFEFSFVLVLFLFVRNALKRNFMFQNGNYISRNINKYM